MLPGLVWTIAVFFCPFLGWRSLGVEGMAGVEGPSSASEGCGVLFRPSSMTGNRQSNGGLPPTRMATDRPLNSHGRGWLANAN
ncbi:uncharacterized protein BKA78DRAFT_302298, partial [Phyllosticta capitalensis]|uniref:uncharacterized protein n=1 Tax=Phyllosticta capitalensis TaxID=121624 RepID=UPI00312DB779